MADPKRRPRQKVSVEKSNPELAEGWMNDAHDFVSKSDLLSDEQRTRYENVILLAGMAMATSEELTETVARMQRLRLEHELPDSLLLSHLRNMDDAFTQIATRGITAARIEIRFSSDPPSQN